MATATALPMSVTTPLDGVELLLAGFTGREGLSRLFHFQLDVRVEHEKKGKRPSGKAVPFDGLLGQKVTVHLTLSDGAQRHFSGICNRLSQEESDRDFAGYRMDVVPEFWLLSRRARSRIFQQQSAPDILKEVLQGLDVQFKLEGTYESRDYCVQYRETDYHFASRLLEEEGIYYYFTHAADGHTLVLADTPRGHPNLPEPSTITYVNVRRGSRDEDCIDDWRKVQEIRSGKYTLWDHHFELSAPIVKADPRPIQDGVQVGGAAHSLNVKLGGRLSGKAADVLELYDHPGEYAQRFDGVAPGGGDRAADLNKIQADANRTAKIRMEQEATPAVVVEGGGNVRHFSSGHKFTLATLEEDGLAKLFKAEGQYVLTGVYHSAQYSGQLRADQMGDFSYSNSFTCIPTSLPFRPPRDTPKPIVQGTQTATVVGPSDEEIFTDKYSRVKVQFHWDRDGQNDGDSSCWVRVASFWAGKQWGAIDIPRIGQEVVVAFEEGDPDQPLIIGSVYNAKMMPPYALPDNRTQSGVKSRSSLNGSDENFNELRFEDKKYSEEIYFHAEKDFNRVVENNDTLKVGFQKKDKGDQQIEVFNNQTLKVGCDQSDDGSQTITIYKDRTATIATGDESLTVKQGDRTVTVEQGGDTHQIKQGDRTVKIDMGKDTLTISMGDHKMEVSMGKSEMSAMQSLELKVGQSSVKLEQSGVTIKGLQVKIEADIQAEMKGAMAKVSGDGMLTLKGGLTMIN